MFSLNQDDMKKWLLIVVLSMQAFVVSANENGNVFSAIDALPPDQRFRQLSLMLLVSEGAGEALIAALTGETGSIEATPGSDDPTTIDFDQYTTPLVRIVDQQTMLQGATRLFRFTQVHAAGIAERLRALHQEGLDSDAVFTRTAVSEDAIIIRNAIADSIDYMMAAEPSGANEPGSEYSSLAADYRARTIYLRNNLEYELFAAELEQITSEAISDVVGRTEAYERMFDDEVDGQAIDKKIRAAEYAYGWDRDFDERAAKLAEKMLETIPVEESTPDL